MAVGGVDFNNRVFRERLLTDKILVGRYKTALDTLFSRTKVKDKSGTWLEFGPEDSIKENTKLANLWATPQSYGGKKGILKFTLDFDSLTKGIPNVADMEDEMILKEQNLIFRTLSEALYQSVFKRAFKVLTDKNEIKVSGKIKTGAENIIETIEKAAGNLAIRPSQVVMNEKLANKVLTEAVDGHVLAHFQVGTLDYEKLGKIIGVPLIVLSDPKKLMDDKIIIMYKDDSEYATETALRNFVYDGVKKFHNGEYARVYPTAIGGIDGLLNCQLSIACNPKIADESLIKVIHVTYN